MRLLQVLLVDYVNVPQDGVTEEPPFSAWSACRRPDLLTLLRHQAQWYFGSVRWTVGYRGNWQALARKTSPRCSQRTIQWCPDAGWGCEKCRYWAHHHSRARIQRRIGAYREPGPATADPPSTRSPYRSGTIAYWGWARCGLGRMLEGLFLQCPQRPRLSEAVPITEEALPYWTKQRQASPV